MYSKKLCFEVGLNIAIVALIGTLYIYANR